MPRRASPSASRRSCQTLGTRRIQFSQNFGMDLYFECANFEGKDALPKGWDEAAFKYCNFRELKVEGPGFGGVLVGCVIEDSDWYWSLFNTGTFFNVEFRNCVFRGASFAGCTFTECKFTDCSFVKDNLGGECRFTENRWYACTQSGCIGFTEPVAQCATGLG